MCWGWGGGGGWGGGVGGGGGGVGWGGGVLSPNALLFGVVCWSLSRRWCSGVSNLALVYSFTSLSTGRWGTNFINVISRHVTDWFHVLSVWNWSQVNTDIGLGDGLVPSWLQGKINFAKQRQCVWKYIIRLLPIYYGVMNVCSFKRDYV